MIKIVLLAAGILDMASSFTSNPYFWNARTATTTVTTKKAPFQSTASARSMSTSSAESTLSTKAMPNFNSVDVAKQGGIGMATASEQALEQNLSLGAPPARPKCGHFMTKGGIQVTCRIWSFPKPSKKERQNLLLSI
jgi:hypothetical protein